VARVGARSASLAEELVWNEGTSLAVEENGLARSLQGHLVYEPDISELAYPSPRRLAGAGLHSLVLAPLTLAAEGRALGVLLAARRADNGFSSGDCEFLRQLAEHLALVLNQVQLYRALESAYQDMRQTQRHMIQQEHLRALGQMASGIAHDINNALSPASIYVHMIREREPNIGAEAREQLAIVERAIEDVGNTVGRMREFYRRGEVDFTPAPVNLNQIVEHVIALTQARWSDIPRERGKVIDVRTELAPDLPSVMGSESELRDGLVNLVLNAVDAMPDGGTLTFRTRSAEEARVRIDVQDTGVGMDEQTRRRCIEPFFTTKGERGTGLGLPMVYGMLERHSGEIEIDSSTGHGTRVSLSFPAASEGDSTATGAYLALLPAHSLRVLTIDDDPLILSALRDILERDGHSVVTAEGGQEGIDNFLAAEGGSGRFSVVITDLGMPHIDGRSVAATVKATRPEVVVLLLTGWGRRMKKQGECPEHVDRILSKPPKLSDLRAALAEAEARVGAS
jgi:signal transduction histidine kinase/CheY-like chemotaxis protein